jgi:hypothetical protein
MKNISSEKLAIIGLVIIAVVWLIVGIFDDAEGAEPLVPAPVCPVDTISIAKFDPALWDRQDFETGFEYGTEYIDIARLFFGGGPELLELTWFASVSDISHVCLKAGTEVACRPGPFVTGTPYDEVTPNGKGISHIEWCRKSEPTAVTVSSASAMSYDHQRFLIVVGVLVLATLTLGLVVIKTMKD